MPTNNRATLDCATEKKSPLGDEFVSRTGHPYPAGRKTPENGATPASDCVTKQLADFLALLDDFDAEVFDHLLRTSDGDPASLDWYRQASSRLREAADLLSSRLRTECLPSDL